MSQSRQLTIAEVLSRAKKASKRGNSALAAQLYSAVLQQQPNHPVAKKGLRKLQKKSPKNQFMQAQATNPPQHEIDTLINLYHSAQMEKVEQSCRELLQTFPNSLTVINVLGTALQVQGKLHEAVHAFDKAIQLKPDSADAYSNRGNALKELRQFEEAVASYDKAIQIKPEYAEAYHNRGNALKDLGQLEEAAASYDKAIEYKPDFAGAHLNLSVLKKYQPDDAHIGAMEGLLLDSRINESARTELYFALAKAYEDLAQYDKSFEYLQEGNRLRKKELCYDIESDRNLFACIKRVSAADAMAPDVASDKTASIDPVFIVGMMRSGTSLVEQILASHTEVHGAGELETINQFVSPVFSDFLDKNSGRDDGNLPAVDINMVRSVYLDALAAFEVDERVITDKMPLNFRWIGIILSAFPDAKIIHLRRDPRAVCWSIYKHYFSTKGNGYAYDLGDLADFYNLYTDLMAFWHQRYSNRIYDICYEDLTENQEQETRKLLAFCDLEWQVECLNFHKTKRVVKTTSATQVRKKMYKGSSEAWRNYEDQLQPLIRGLKVRD